jgi:hypothetical protein
MTPEDESEPKIIVDEDWKSRVQREREQLEKQPQPTSATSPQPPAAPRLPPASFASLVSSLTAQAAAALGDAASPYDPQKNAEQQLEPKLALELARHLIDTLAILDEKTRGNVTPEEAMLLEQGLHELRMAFVEVQKRS